MLNRLFSFLTGANKDGKPADSPHTHRPLGQELQRHFVYSYIDQVGFEREGSVPNGVYETSIVSFVYNHERIEGS